MLCGKQHSSVQKQIKLMSKPTVPELLSKSKADIIAFLGGIYEHSSWIAETFYEEHMNGKDDISTSISNVRDLYQRMSSVVDNATQEQK